MMLQLYLPLSGVIFRASWRLFLDVARDLFGGSDSFTRRLFDTVREYLSAAISWLNFRPVVFGDASRKRR
jgi:hypothetical protein